ncbi:hypothetical protein CPB85DRAFT_1249065 [Mucidula mucida]|nr:hypothetical protein CPB85DRAFT_1249065 [Mucidula mucida]
MRKVVLRLALAKMITDYSVSESYYVQRVSSSCPKLLFLLAHLGKCIAFDTPEPERHAILDYVQDIEQAEMSCRDRVSRLTAVLADAQSQLHSLEKLRSAHIRLSPPIHMLPAEVLLDIFELAVEKPYNFSSIDEGPWRLGQYPKDMLATVFERSLPLVFDYEMTSEGECTDIVESHSLRWQNVTFLGSVDDFLHLRDVGPLPLLVDIVLRIQRRWTGWTECTPAEILHFFRSAPKLQSLKLTSELALEGLTSLPSAISWHQLTHLEYSIRWSTFLFDCQILIHCPLLQSFVTHSDNEPGSSDVVPHSKLTFLGIQHVALLRYLHCTSLTELKLTGITFGNEGLNATQPHVLALRTFLAHSPLLASISYVATSAQLCYLISSTFTSVSIQTFKFDISGLTDVVLPLVAFATPLLLPKMTVFECTNSPHDPDMVQTLLAVI